ncbi:hypothetical protein LC55x_0087 [Lysobacter capsici]|uniref:hypothetical protein n=1 Tax=Lysobacter capsici TaxID=435897 RepID=UPI0006279A1F|nr:hypothetical protein [Lysobacter capsici]ALN83392.1 hypothetical protein LC55x_0087 [Lysobacter capsici]
MQLIDQRDWAWTLYADGERRYLSVLCGTIASYELTLELDAGERARIGEQGFVDALASEVAYRPDSYKARHVAGFRAAD